MALLSYAKLDLAYVPVVVAAPFANMSRLYDICRSHPYIAYSVRTLGGTDGAFLVFTVPNSALASLVDFLDELAARGVIYNYRMFVTDEVRRIFCTPDLLNFDPANGSWRFDWQKWSESEPKSELNGGSPGRTLLVQPDVHLLEQSDVELLRILSDDAKVPTEDISKEINVLPHNVRRRIQFLEDNGFIIGYRTMITYSKFHLTSPSLFDCNAQPAESARCIRKLAELPFPGTIIPVQNGFLAMLTLPSDGLPAVHRLLSKDCSNVDVSWFDLASSDVAVLNSKAFVDGRWRTDPGFMVKDPLGPLSK
jgi:DNA-binding Lrp family transcriptional regulator